MSGRPGPYGEALTAARRVYDRQIAELENIDDKAMRTARTGVIVLGFVAAALATSGPGVASGLRLLTVLYWAFSVLVVTAATFVGVGVYTVTEYPLEVRKQHVQQAVEGPPEGWVRGAIREVNETRDDLDEEISKNAAYLEVAQLLLVAGGVSLFLSTAMTVARHSFSVQPRWVLVVLLVAMVATVVGVRVIGRDGVI